MTSAKYVTGIDGLRAVAVIAVILFHLNPVTVPGGFVGVDIFFVISGYVISQSLYHSTTNTLSSYILNFYKRRILRIMPALLFCIIITSIFSTVFIPQGFWLSGSNNLTALSSIFGLSNIYLVNFADGYFSQRISFNPYVHTWSLAVEEQFYFVFPLIIYYWRLYKDKTNSSHTHTAKYFLLILFLISLAYSAYETTYRPDHAYYMLPSRFWELAIGGLIFQLTLTNYKLSNTTASYGLIVGCLMIFIGLIFATEKLFPFPWALPAVIGTALVIYSLLYCTNDNYVHKTLTSTPFVFLGKISYSLYLWHWPIFVLFNWTIGLQQLQNIILAVGLTFLFSLLSFNYVERYFRVNEHLHKLKSRTIVLSGVTVSLLFTVFLGGIFYLTKVGGVGLSVANNDCLWKPYTVQCDESMITKNDNDPSTNKHNLIVIGDSHAGAYTRMLNIAAKELQFNLKTKFVYGCPIIKLTEISNQNLICIEAENETLSWLKSNTNANDIVLFASLRLSRLSNQWGSFDVENVYRDFHSTEQYIINSKALADSLKWITTVNSLGAQVLIDAPKPIFKSPIFRCLDWFNKHNPACNAEFSIGRDWMLEYRTPVMESLDKLHSQYGVAVWDPFPVLCPDSLCNQIDGDKPLFFDGDHLSGYGNLLLADSFKKKIKELWGI